MEALPAVIAILFVIGAASVAIGLCFSERTSKFGETPPDPSGGEMPLSPGTAHRDSLFMGFVAGLLSGSGDGGSSCSGGSSDGSCSG